ncbi:MAG: hypothetical protein HYX68_19950 [Planctomycetes bacterium]|nr:hypothetical protein [Planctomycetota bacterium]
MADIPMRYVRLSSVTASTGAEKRLLSSGTGDTDYKGSLQFAALTLAAGDIIRIHPWGRYENESTSDGSGRFRLYFNNGNPATLANPIADSLANPAQPWPPNPQVYVNGTITIEWHFLAYITIRSAGGTDSWCDALVEWVDRPGTSNKTNCNKMMGLGSFDIDTSQANSLELTAHPLTNGSIILDQCSIEWLGPPLT